MKNMNHCVDEMIRTDLAQFGTFYCSEALGKILDPGHIFDEGGCTGQDASISYWWGPWAKQFISLISPSYLMGAWGQTL
jgi:hypothetical protein